MKQGADPAEELCVDHLPRPFPLEVFVVETVIPVQLVKILSQVLGSIKIVHVNEGLLRSTPDIVLLPGQGDIYKGESKEDNITKPNCILFNI